MDHTVMNCDCSLKAEDGFKSDDTNGYTGTTLDGDEFYRPRKGTGWKRQPLMSAGYFLSPVFVPEDPDYAQHVEIKCIECGEQLHAGDPVDRIHINNADDTFGEAITCMTCANIRKDFAGSGGQSIGNLRAQIYVCLGFDYLGDENWAPDLDNLPGNLQNLYKRLKGGAK